MTVRHEPRAYTRATHYASLMRRTAQPNPALRKITYAPTRPRAASAVEIPIVAGAVAYQHYNAYNRTELRRRPAAFPATAARAAASATQHYPDPAAAPAPVRVTAPVISHVKPLPPIGAPVATKPPTGVPVAPALGGKPPTLTPGAAISPPGAPETTPVGRLPGVVTSPEVGKPLTAASVAPRLVLRRRVLPERLPAESCQLL